MNRRDFLGRVAILTGSVAFGVATHKSDEDWLISKEDFEAMGLSSSAVGSVAEEGSKSIRVGNQNFIVYGNTDFRNRWMKAHRHCVIERPSDKARRIKIFRHYLHGELLG
jgi:hypothetical protein